MAKRVAERAGTKLNHGVAERVVVGGQQLGMIDRSNDLYQLGGSRAKHVLWKDKVLGLGISEWDHVREQVGTIEFVDHDRNEAWRVAVQAAAFFGAPYTLGGRTRFGIPIQVFDIFDAEGNWLRKGV